MNKIPLRRRGLRVVAGRLAGLVPHVRLEALMSSPDAPCLVDGATLGAAPMGVAKLSKMAFDGIDLWPLWRQLVDRYVFEPGDAAALMDLSTVEQLFGNLDVGLSRLDEALSVERLYRSPLGAAPALRVLAFAGAGDIGSNTPLEFLLGGSDIALTTFYVIPGEPLPAALPEHDVAIVAVGESDEHRIVLAEIERLTADWPRPVLNRPERVVPLAREHLCGLLQNIPGLTMPLTARLTRDTFARLDAGEIALTDVLDDGVFPLIARPVNSHAGLGLERLDDAGRIGPYLAERHEGEFYISRFVDYRSADGLYRKYRIVFVDGRPFACHMALAEQWRIWYLNAGMRENAEKRAAEAAFMASFDEDFAQRHAGAFHALAERIGLDYFAIDCAEMPDGDLVMFEADIAMIVHDMDDPKIYPYKPPQMRKVFDAFRTMLYRAGKPSAASVVAA
jgi:hypothetical protein